MPFLKVALSSGTVLLAIACPASVQRPFAPGSPFLLDSFRVTKLPRLSRFFWQRFAAVFGHTPTAESLAVRGRGSEFFPEKILFRRGGLARLGRILLS